MSLPDRQTGMTAQEARDLAAKLADSGIPCLPIALKWDHEKGKVAKRPLTPNGHYDATTDPEKLAELFRKHVKYGPGEFPGVGTYPGPAGFLVIDVDNLATLEQLETEHGPVPGRRVRTASGGLHIWMRLPEGVEVAQTSPWPGIDIRSSRGWVVAPGTMSPWGGWITEGGKTVLAPAWMLTEILDHETAPRQIPEEAEPGDRHQTLVSLAASMWAKGLTRAAILAAIRGYNETSCKPPKPDDELVDIVEWVVGKEGGPTSVISVVTSSERKVAEDESAQPRVPYIGKAGGDWVLDAPKTVQPVFGEGDQILWSKGEAALFVGSDGSGKTALAHQIISRMVGIITTPLLGLPVVEAKRVAYVAQDRPVQARIAFNRLVGEVDRDHLNDRLVIVDSGLPLLDNRPEMFREIAARNDADVLVIDSLKDVAAAISNEEVGANIKRAYSMALEDGVEVLMLHHDRKSDGVRNRKLLKIDDVYGSRMIRGGCGSVVALNGGSGDPVVELRQLKTPTGIEVGPLMITFDFLTGEVSIQAGTDLVDVIREAKFGITAGDAAKAVFSVTSPSRSETEKARRRLDKLAGQGLVTRSPGGAGEPVKYLPAMELLLSEGGHE